MPGGARLQVILVSDYPIVSLTCALTVMVVVLYVLVRRRYR
jgi:hypothetical protein